MVRRRTEHNKAIEIRPAREDEREAMSLLDANAFRGDFEGARRRSSELDLDGSLCLFENGQLASALKILPYTTFVGGNRLGLGGIGQVMTFADKQGRGYAGRLLRESLRVMRRRGLVLSTLFPFSHAYYHQFGWARSSEHYHYPELTQRDLPEFATGERRLVELFRPGQDIDPLARCHNAIMRRYNLCLERPADQWQSKLLGRLEERKAFVYTIRDAGKLIGWFMCSNQRREGGGHESTTTQMALGNRTALRAFLSFMASLPSSVKQIQLHMPSDLPLWDLLPEPSMVRIKADMQTRIVDLAAALGQRGYRRGASGRLVFHITDRDAAWNHGTWAGRWRAGRLVSLARSKEAPALKADIAEFAQIYYGYKSARELVEAGTVQVASLAALDLLDELFHDRPTHTQDWF